MTGVVLLVRWAQVLVVQRLKWGLPQLLVCLSAKSLYSRLPEEPMLRKVLLAQQRERE